MRVASFARVQRVCRFGGLVDLRQDLYRPVAEAKDPDVLRGEQPLFSPAHHGS